MVPIKISPKVNFHDIEHLLGVIPDALYGLSFLGRGRRFDLVVVFLLRQLAGLFEPLPHPFELIELPTYRLPLGIVEQWL